jgi:uncharacterized protein YbaR (Trm112 family)
MYCKRCGCVFDINDTVKHCSGYGEIINLCPECRTPLNYFEEDMFDEDFLIDFDEDFLIDEENTNG